MSARLSREAWNRARDKMLQEMTAPQSKYMNQVNNAVVGGIIKRTKSGIDIAGMKFKPYTKNYAKKKGYSAADLTLTGQMISRGPFKFQTIMQDRKVTIRIYIEGPHSGNVDMFTLASVHNFGLKSGRHPGFQMTKREFFGIDEAIIKDVKEISIEHWRQIMSDLK
jgi:hypothetical protein